MLSANINYNDERGFMEFIEILKILFLGIVEGITEWLPISSTGHLLLVDELFTLKASQDFKDMFFVVIQLGAILAVPLLFWKRLFPFALEKKSDGKASTDGTVLGLIKALERANADIAVSLPVLTKPSQFDSVARFAIAVNEEYADKDRKII